MNSRIEKIEDNEEEKFLLTVWEGPECYDVTKSEKKVSKYPFSDAGMEEIVKYLNEI